MSSRPNESPETREHRLAYKRRYVAEHREGERERAKRYYYKHRPQMLARHKTYYNGHREEMKAYQIERRKSLRGRLLHKHEHRCACCGETREMFLTLDHKKDDGAAERRLLSWDKIYKKAIEEPGNNRYEVLCFNCNLGKRRNGGVCPHKMVN